MMSPFRAVGLMSAIKFNTIIYQSNKFQTFLFFAGQTQAQNRNEKYLKLGMTLILVWVEFVSFVFKPQLQISILFYILGSLHRNLIINLKGHPVMQSAIIQIGNFSYYSGKVAGQGATGSVYMGFRNSDKTPVAVKVIRLQEMNTNVKRHLLDCEVAALKSIRSKYVCEAYDVLKDGEYYYVPMEFCPNGTLRDYIKSKGKLSESQSLSFFARIVEGYNAIRQAGFIHRDLKTENILLRANMEPVLIDFGYCQKLQTTGQSMTYNVGSPAYMSPQAYNESIYSEKSDVWALGVILHQMVTGTIPLMRTQDPDEYFRYLKNMKTAEIVRGQYSEYCSKIMLRALTVDHRLRPNAKQLQLMLNGTNIQNPTQRSLIRYDSLNQPKVTSLGIIPINEGSSKNLTMSGTLNIASNRQIAFSGNNIKTSENSSNASLRNYTLDSPTYPLRQTMPSNSSPSNLNFANLRKRIQTNEFQLNLAPVRTIQNVEQFRKPQQKTIPISNYQPVQHLSFQRIPSVGDSPTFEPPSRLKKTYSTSSINLQPIYRY